MKRNRVKPLIIIGCLITLTCAAFVYASKTNPFRLWPGPGTNPKNGIVILAGQMTQDKILYGGDGLATLALTMSADEVLDSDNRDARHVDMVIVLDRSGSMQGKKLQDARQAVLGLLSSLTSKDRFGLVAYSDSVQTHSRLVSVTPANRKRLNSLIGRISAGGATNLGAGLHEGIDVCLSARKNGNVGKVILISDGLANRGVTSIHHLGNMASTAVKKEFAVSTVGVGADFNEQLMTQIADRGAGNYYYLENPSSFAAVFQKEFHNTRTAAATAVEIRVPLKNGISLVTASGYPVEIKDNQAVIYPGDLLSGQTRKLFLTLQIPTHKEGTYEVNGIKATYKHNGHPYTVTMSESFRLACVKDQQEVLGSIDRKEWEEKVLKDDFNKLREEVAADIKKGEKKAAMKRIDSYRGRQQAVNSVVGSSGVATNLERDVGELRKMVDETFQGAPQEVQVKQKKNAKALQYEGYKARRSKSN